MDAEFLCGGALAESLPGDPLGELRSPVFHAPEVAIVPTECQGVPKINVALLPTVLVPPLQSSPVPDFSVQQTNRKALIVIRENIRALLASRNESQTALAAYCRHDKSWINKFLNEGRGLQFEDLDLIAAFFGANPYQLLQPGFARVTERRKGERRSSKDRRIGTDGRLASSLQSEVNKFPRLSRRTDYDFGALPAAARAIIEKADRDLAALEATLARGQAATARRTVAGTPKGRRGPGGPDPKTPA